MALKLKVAAKRSRESKDQKDCSYQAESMNVTTAFQSLWRSTD